MTIFDVIKDYVLGEDNIMFKGMDRDMINAFVKVAYFHTVSPKSGQGKLANLDAINQDSAQDYGGQWMIVAWQEAKEGQRAAF